MAVDHAAAREQLAALIARRDLVDQRVIDAIATVERHRFVPQHLQSQAYADRPLPIGSEQTISQPTVIAIMVDALELEPDDIVLDVGTGSGYAAAVLAELAGEVWSIERRAELAERAQAVLGDMGCDNVHVVVGDGSLGLPDHAPYDAIAVAAVSPDVPDALRSQLADGGRLVLPVGALRGAQRLVRIERSGSEFVERDLGGVAFVPLLGEQGF